MHHSFWYFSLIFLSLVLFCFILFKKRNTKVILLYLTMVGFGYMIETTIFNFLGSYDYNPNFIKHSFYDNELGAFVSNAFSLPVTAVLIATFRLNWIWILILAGLFVGVEWLFLKLHIYSHNWWRLAYSCLGFPVYYVFAKIFYNWILQSSKGFKHIWLLYLIIGSISASAHVLPIVFFENRSYHPGWFENHGRDTIAFAAAFYLCASFYYCLMVKINWRTIWTKYIFTGFLMFIVNQVLKSIGILHSHLWWDQLYYICISLLLIFLADRIDAKLYTTPYLKEGKLST
ncbi:hypothetical protein ACFSO7_11410 [Bacillus sp. CGMCC 1.16607]|uniref:hypothetical protein n=1 Tax=Bacillus sp. CGMCC 1.16607 TaxID=3351842 RepID=UPI00363B54DB